MISIGDVLALILVIFSALSYIDNRNSRPTTFLSKKNS